MNKINYLEKIKNPGDVKKLSLEETLILTNQVRKRIIEVTSKNGGHIGPSLGATDIAVAITRCFDLEKDKIIWDVGHQSYAYKILTGRNKEFSTLRQFNGLGGFNNPKESKYDAFRVGHTSTSISSATGIALAEKSKGNKNKIVAIIGDGAMTGGLAFEALNYAGSLNLQNLIVILNDNKMSISPNVGALQNYLTNILTSKRFNYIKRKVWDSSKKLPSGIRRKFIHGAQKIQESVKNVIVPNIIFEDLGFHYLGPIDGNNLPRVIKILNKAKSFVDGPIFIHAYTKKGKGYSFAESDAAKFHGVSPFKEETGLKKKPSKLTYSAVFGKKLVELASQNKDIVAITAAMMQGTGLSAFKEKFPEKVYDVGIAEQHAVTMSGGMAIQGLKPFVAIYSTFLQRAYDQIIHDIALQKLPVVFCIDRAGIVGEDGPTHHGAFDLSYLNLIPNLVIMAPNSRLEMEKMLEFASEYNDGPVALRYPRGEVKEVDYEIDEISLGKWQEINKGSKICLIATGKAFIWAEEIFKKLQTEFSVEEIGLINGRFIKPIDEEKLAEIQADYLFTFEDNSVKGGFGSTISNYYCNDEKKVFNFGLPDKFITHGNTERLFDSIDLDSEKMFRKILDLVKEK